MRNAVEQEIDRFLHTGVHDALNAPWPGASVIERANGANAGLRDALVREVLGRARHATMPASLDTTDLVSVTRGKVSPMVLGLFPAHEQPTVLDVLARSVIYLTPRNIEAIVKSEMHLSTAWNLANLYLLSCDAGPLSPDAPQIIGLSQATTCYVSMQYFRAGRRFDDVVVHEAAHIFHNCKRERIGLKGTRRREWLLEVDFGKRETFAYACEALSRIHELGDSARARRELLSEVEAGPMPSDERVDANEFVDILCEAVGARNGWRRILQRCSPRPRRAVGATSAAAK